MAKALILTIFISAVAMMVGYPVAFKKGQQSKELPSGTMVVTEKEWSHLQARKEEAVNRVVQLKQELLELRKEKEEVNQKLLETQAALDAGSKEILVLEKEVKGLRQDAIRLGHLVPEPREREKAE